MKKILLVEDNELNMDLALQILEDDYEVTTANNGQEAIDSIAKVYPDLILMDLSMPGMDGWEATRNLRARSDTANIPIIALSAHAIPHEIQRAMDAGCNAFVTKPLDDEELLEKIEELLAG